MDPLQQALQELKASKLKHVVFGEYRRDQSLKCASVLCEEAAICANVINAEANTPSAKNENALYYLKKDGERTPYSLLLYQKGRGLFPERFETEMLASAVVINDTFMAVDSEREFWSTLYSEVIHRGILKRSVRKIVIEKLRSRVGGMFPKPKYQVGFNDTETPTMGAGWVR